MLSRSCLQLSRTWAAEQEQEQMMDRLPIDEASITDPGVQQYPRVGEYC